MSLFAGVSAAAMAAGPAKSQFFDQGTYAGSSGGSANAQTLAIPNYQLNVGVVLRALMSFSNSGALTLNVNGTGAVTVQKQTSSGLAALTGGEIVAGQVCEFLYDGTRYQFLDTQVGASGGGSGLAEVSSVSALQSLAISNASAMLTQSGRFGLFNWNGSNLSTQVTNDPQQGIYVWGNGDSTGASGAWVKQYADTVSLLWWGGKGDGVNTFATGSAAFPTNPSATNTFTVGGTVVTFVASGATGNQVNIGGTAALTAAALLAFLQASSDSNISQCSYALSGTTTINVTYNVVGTNGNSFGMSTTVSGATVSSSLSGGATTGTDNSTALNGFNSWAKTQTGGVTLWVPPGTYNFNHSLCQGYLYNIPMLAIFGYGATFLNTYNGSANFAYQLPWGPACGPNLHPTNPLIASTVAGQRFVTCLTASQASAFTPNMSIMIGSLDIQYFGYPPNLDLFDFVTVTSVDVPNGTVNFANDYLRNVHRADYPDGPNSNPCGKARIYTLDSNGPWNVQHTYYGLNILQGPALPLQNYCQQTGKSITFIDCNIPGISPSVCGHASYIRCNFTSPLPNEPDKLVDICEFDGCTAVGLVNFQSSSFNLVKAKGCKFNTFGAGTAKNVDVDTCNINSLTTGQNYGLGRNCSIRNSNVFNGAIPPTFSNGLNVTFTVDGSTITYSNGTFTITNASGILTNGFSVIPGSRIFMVDGTNGYTADRCVGTVISMVDSGSSVAITTTLPYSTLASGTPSWFNGKIYINHSPITKVYGGDSCDSVRQLMEATTAGKYNGEYIRTLFCGKPNQNPVFQPVGELVEIDVNVIQASTVSNAKFKLTQFGAPTYPGFINPFVYILTFDLTVVGKRTWTLAALTGETGADSVTLNGSTQTALPAVWINGGLFGNFNFDPTGNTPQQNGIFEVVMIFDTGAAYKLVPAQFDQSSPTSLAVAGIVGQLP